MATMSSMIQPTVWQNHRIEWGARTYVMGIVNVAPDSFSGDGLALDTFTEDMWVQWAVKQAKKFVAEGAVSIDVGGESTRPGAASISVEQELARVIPVIKALHEALPAEVMISIDTYKAEVAEQAIAAGACIINDIWALRRDPAMAKVAATHEVPVILMANMSGYQKHEVVSDAVRFLAGSID